jgi:hypothetical protein
MEAPPDQQAIPILVLEEILRGRLNVVRQADERLIYLAMVLRLAR